MFRETNVMLGDFKSLPNKNKGYYRVGENGLYDNPGSQ